MFVKKLTLVTGGFDPIHSGHIEYFKEASKLSDFLVIGLNSDEWLINKKQQAFQDWDERANIIKHLDMVSMVIDWDDSDKTACGAIEKCLLIAGESTGRLIGTSIGTKAAPAVSQVPIVGWLAAGWVAMLGGNKGAEVGGEIAKSFNDC